MNHLARFNALKDQLVEAGAHVRYHETELELTRGEIPYLEKESGIKVTEEVFDFYHTLNGADLSWNMTVKGQSLSGFMSIQSYIGVLRERIKGRLWVDWYESEDIERIKAHKIFEFIEGTDYYITIRFEKDGSYKLYYVAEGAVNHGGSKNLPEIPLSIAQYFQVIAGYYGFPTIRYHLHKEEFYTRPFEVVPELIVLKEIFPGFNPPKI